MFQAQLGYQNIFDGGALSFIESELYCCPLLESIAWDAWSMPYFKIEQNTDIWKNIFELFGVWSSTKSNFSFDDSDDFGPKFDE